ncbi:hypothetical protein RDWZM_001335 [Blomia tropicalis]|uniref:Uncharacterized protein n=1 Tax=Blomia tropicalis TaxID=40697 RepID=A0A9Q0RQM5_BLOTA|nr:hypothetical protein RDWZM_001335 [Blomia tropicalis]
MATKLIFLTGFVILGFQDVHMNPIVDQYFNGEIARTRFCSQKYFDSISYDGLYYKFTVNRKLVGAQNHRYRYSEYKLKFDSNSNLFYYETATIENHNQVPIGGFFVNKLNTFIEFYKNLATNTLSFCTYTYFSEFDRDNYTRKCFSIGLKQSFKNDCDLNSIATSLDDNNQETMSGMIKTESIFSCDVFQYLLSKRSVAFAYDAKLEKIFYIFSDRENPIVINSLRSFTGTDRVNWFVKDIDKYRTYKFVGSFNGIGSSNSPLMLAHPKWMRTESVLLELDDSSKFILNPKHISWKEYFGCFRKVGQFQSWQNERTEDGATYKKGRSWLNPFTIVIISTFSHFRVNGQPSE